MITKKNFFVHLTVFLIMIAPVFSQTLNYWMNFKINTNEALWTGAYPVVATLSNGNLVFCWLKERKVIVGRIYNPELEPISSELILYNESNKTSTNFKQLNNDEIKEVTDHELAVLGLNNGDFVIFWQDNAGPCRAKIFTANGEDRGISINIVPPRDNDVYYPSLALLKNGNFVVCWHLGPSAGGILSGDSDGIYCQIFNQLGNTVSDVIKVNTLESFNEWNPTISVLNDSLFIICWQDGLSDIEISNIYGQLFNIVGDKENSEFKINPDTSNYNYNPYVKKLKGDNFMVVWERGRMKICGQQFSSSAEKEGDLVLTDKNGKDSTPVLSYLNNGNIILGWNEGDRVTGQLFNSSWKSFDSKYVIGSRQLHNEYVKVISFKDGFLTCWQNNNDIIGRYYLNEPIVHELEEFLLYEPVDDDTLYTTIPSFIWGKTTHDTLCFPFEIKYDFYIDQDYNFTNPIMSKNLSDTSYTFPILSADKTYFWKIVARNIAGDSVVSSNINAFYISPNTAIAKNDKENIPVNFKLFQNYPNPFNPLTTINYELPITNFVELRIFNLLGQKIVTLILERQQAGKYQVKWDATEFPSGVYYYQLTAGNFMDIKKMIVIK